ncbi:MAG TPA: ATP-binding cassette domain-containing protein [Solirubrobacteraceae bacterium]|jgi:ABC-type multidrug transport system ATPase subunit
MSLLELEHVTLLEGSKGRETLLLNDVSLEIDPGELVAVWGKRRSGRSTLLRVVAGMQRPDSGVVRFAGRELAGSGALGEGIGFCGGGLRATDGWQVLEQMVGTQLARGVPQPAARSRALNALERTGAGHCADRRQYELRGGDAVRTMLAIALATEPQLLVLDDAITGVDLLERDEILLLLRSLADEGLAVLTSTDEGTGLSGADRALALSEGRLRGSVAPRLAPVVPLRRAAGA